MTTEQKLTPIEPKDLIAKTTEYKNNAFRLVQISCTALKESIELSYSFGKGLDIENLRIVLSHTNPEVPSISGVYWNAFLYENEIHDLFGVKITDIAIDYKGKFYRTQVKTPFINKSNP